MSPIYSWIRSPSSHPRIHRNILLLGTPSRDRISFPIHPCVTFPPVDVPFLRPESSLVGTAVEVDLKIGDFYSPFITDNKIGGSDTINNTFVIV